MKTKHNDSGPEIINAGKTPVRKPAEDIVAGAGNQDQLDRRIENAARKPIKTRKSARHLVLAVSQKMAGLKNKFRLIPTPGSLDKLTISLNKT
ncbi:hypothetical protein [Pedobacter suwonensis]|uniref:hypothetical protein n=1 Tax=Pedobacter suwonensis TaxID=332999 RepID=UPI0011A7D6ED|nr:hypothetical protein [Pedobacter suwonensis]